MSKQPPAIIVLGEGSVAAARKVQQALSGSRIHGLADRVTDVDTAFAKFGDAMRVFFSADVPLVVFCAAGIVIRTLAPLLQDKRAEPPVIAVAEDGSAVVPLLGGLRGVNELARIIGDALGTRPAITTTGEVRFGATLEQVPAGYEVRNPGAGKRFMSDLLAGERVQLSGSAPWLSESKLPFDSTGRLSIRVTPEDVEPAENELIIHPHSVLVTVSAGYDDLSQHVVKALADRGLVRQAVAAVVACERDATRPEIYAVATELNRPLRFVAEAVDQPVSLTVASHPVDISSIGRGRGRLAVVGLGPGTPDWLAPEARRELETATEIVGYETYVRLAGPFRPDQTVHASDNREELDRARHALRLAGQGRSVAVVSSGDPGVFAMSAAVMEALDGSRDPAWHGVEIAMIPGISAAQAAAARAGAPLGHDFCVLSLSDNLKPWPVIEQRLRAAAAADLAIALYNPLSRARPWQFGKALEILRDHRAMSTPVVLGRDVGRPDENVRVVPLGELTPEQVDMRTVVLIGSSITRSFSRVEGGTWVYTPRWYGEEPKAKAGE
jgi:cobalt-precorrin 5A hydrolase/precorrin-3B C17-methyltransferase